MEQKKSTKKQAEKQKKSTKKQAEKKKKSTKKREDSILHADRHRFKRVIVPSFKERRAGKDRRSGSAELTKRVKKDAIDKVGFDIVGVADAHDPQFDNAPEGHKPDEWLPGAKSVVVGGIKVLSEILQTTPSPGYSKHYDQLNTWLAEAGYQLSKRLQKLGFKARWFPESPPYSYLFKQRNSGEKGFSPSFCHIHSAVAAGLGVRGKIGVVLTPQFGPRVRWMTVVTTANLIPDPKFEGELCLDRITPDSCGDKCIKACGTLQTGALRPWPETNGVSMYRCNWFSLRDQGLACGTCMNECPVGKE